MKKLTAFILIVVLLLGNVYAFGDTAQPASSTTSQTATVFIPKAGQTVTFSVVTYQSHKVSVYVNNTKMKEAKIELNEQNQYAFSYEWNGTLEGNCVPAGQYTVSFRYDIFFSDGSRNSKWDDTFSVTVKEPTATTPSTFTVDGYIKPMFLKSHLAKDAAYPMEVPLEGLTVEIRDLREGCTDTSEDANSTLLTKVVTDANGYFKATGISNDLSASENGKDIFVKLRLDDSIAKITDSFDNVYTWSSNVYRDFKGAQISYGSLRPSFPDQPQYLSIWYWLRKGHEFYKSNTGTDLGQVHVKSEKDLAPTNSSVDYMNIGDGDCYDPAVILHEYGHWIMYAMGVHIQGGGQHWIEESLDAKVAYKEGWASFFACMVLKSSHYIDTNINNIDSVLDVDYENISCYHNYLCNLHNTTGTESLAGFYGSLYEINTGVVLLDLCDTNNESADKVTLPFSYVNSAMLYKDKEGKINENIYDYYDDFYSMGYADDNKRKVWDVFGDRKVSHDIQVPTVSIEVLYKTPEGIVYNGTASDNIDIVEYTWLIDGREVEKGIGYPGTYTVDLTHYTASSHTITLRAKDSEGYYNFYWISKTNERASAYGEAAPKIFVGTGARNSSDATVPTLPSDGAVPLYPGSGHVIDDPGTGSATLLPSSDSGNETDFNLRDIKKAYKDLLKGIPDNEEALLEGYSYTAKGSTNRYELTVSESSDLKIYCHAAGPADRLNIYDPTGKLAASAKNIYPDEPVEIKNAKTGNWTIELVPFSQMMPEEIIPFALAATATPSLEESDIPQITSSRILSIKGCIDENQTLNIDINGKCKKYVKGEHGHFETVLELEEGKNVITIENTNGRAKSKQLQYEVFVDTTAPVITLENIEEDQITVNAERFVLTGCVSSDTAVVMINGKPSSIDEWRSIFGEVYGLKQGTNVFEIKAVDHAGNSTVKVIEVVRQ